SRRRRRRRRRLVADQPREVGEPQDAAQRAVVGDRAELGEVGAQGEVEGPVAAPQPDAAAGGQVVAILEVVEPAGAGDGPGDGGAADQVLAAAVEVPDRLGDPVEVVADPPDVADAGVGIAGEDVATWIVVAEVDHPLVDAPAEAAAPTRLPRSDLVVARGGL